MKATTSSWPLFVPPSPNALIPSGWVHSTVGASAASTPGRSRRWNASYDARTVSMLVDMAAVLLYRVGVSGGSGRLDRFREVDLDGPANAILPLHRAVADECAAF